MYKVEQVTINKAYKPFDVVSNCDNAVGIIVEVSVNDSQSSPEHQISYAVNWLTGNTRKSAWFNHRELTKHCNLMVVLAKQMCNPMGTNTSSVNRLMYNIGNENMYNTEIEE